MARSNTVGEKRTKDHMSAAYKSQDGGGWQDWGMFTAHVVHGLIQEVNDLRSALKKAGVAEPPPRDPFDG